MTLLALRNTEGIMSRIFHLMVMTSRRKRRKEPLPSIILDHRFQERSRARTLRRRRKSSLEDRKYRLKGRVTLLVVARRMMNL